MTRPETRPPLRVLIVTEDDPLYVVRFFEVFFAECPRDRIDLVGITVSEAFHEPMHRTALRMWRFYGPTDFVRLCFRFALAKVKGRNIAALARGAGVPIVPTASVNDPAYVARVRDELTPDVIVSVARRRSSAGTSWARRGWRASTSTRGGCRCTAA